MLKYGAFLTVIKSALLHAQ